MSEQAGVFGLALPYDSDHPEFARGFECGYVYALARGTDEPFNVTVHKTNAEMMIRIAEATNREVRSVEFQGAPPGGGEWVHMTCHFRHVGSR